jgi:O-acetyl-ADP-ribose deacetylase
MPSSTPPTDPSSAAAEWTAPYTGPQGPNCWQSAGASTGETGQAKITKGYRLPANFVIHTVGPIWRGGGAGEERLLREAYHNSLRLAAENGLKTIAFPNISTGVYAFPKDRAAAIAIKTSAEFLKRHPEIEKVVFVCFDRENFDIYEKALAEMELA